MDRIGPAGGSPTVTLTNGQQGFVDENLSTGQEGTEVVANFMNAVQEELMSILAAAGTTPNIANFGQVLASLGTLFGGGGNVNDGWQILPGGMIVQWFGVSSTPNTFQVPHVLPTTFPNNCFAVFAALAAFAGAGSPASIGAANDPGNLGSVLVSNSNSSGAADGVYILAIGN